MRVLIPVAVFLALVAGAFGYCREFGMDLTIDTGGGGDFVINYVSTDPDYCQENTNEDIVAEYQGSGGSVGNCVISEPDVGVIVVSYSVDFDDIEDTDDYGVFGFFPDVDYTITLTREDTSYVYQNSIFIDVDNYDVYNDFTYNYKVVCPYSVISTNGNISPGNSKEVNWSYTFFELVEAKTTDLMITYGSQ
jgi:hypothetical protein